MGKRVDVAYVNIWGNLVGAVSWNPEKEYATFEFDQKFLNMGMDLSPIVMPLSEAIKRKQPSFEFRNLPKNTFRGLPGLLSDSLPDKFGNSIIDSWLSREGRTPETFSPIERLCYTGKRGMGALEFKPILNKDIEKSVPVEVSKLLELAQTVINERSRLNTNFIDNTSASSEALLNIIRVGTSAGGNRPKAVIAYNKQTNEVRSGQVKASEGFEYWILKFDGIKDDSLGNPKGFGKIEYSYSKMAKSCGIDMTDCELLKENSRYHFMTKRFDRVEGEKIHLQTLCAISHFDFNSPGAYSYEQAFMVLRELNLPPYDIEQLYRRMVFNVISRNQDDHTKNISFLMDKNGNWKLSPAYDVIYSYNPKGEWTNQHQMTINGKRDEFTLKDLYKVGADQRIDSYRSIAKDISDVISTWPKIAKELDIKKSYIDEIRDAHRLSIVKNSSISFSV